MEEILPYLIALSMIPLIFWLAGRQHVREIEREKRGTEEEKT